MARSAARAQRRRRPAPGWARRNRGRIVVAVVAAGLAGALALAVTRDGDGSDADGSDRRSSSSASGLTGADFHSLVVYPADARRLFVGGHQAVSVSNDGGRSWTEIESLRDADAMGWAFVDDHVYVSGHPGLSRSTDGGRTFERANEGLPDTDVHAFGGTGDVLYGASPAAGVFASTGRAGEWRIRTAADGQAFFGRIVVDPEDGEHLYAADARRGVVESSDGGRTWRRLDSGLPATWLSGSTDLAVLVASGLAGAVRSDDQGRSWHRMELPDGASLVEVDGSGSVLYAGSHRGTRVEVSVSRDGGASWQRA